MVERRQYEIPEDSPEAEWLETHWVDRDILEEMDDAGLSFNSFPDRLQYVLWTELDTFCATPADLLAELHCVPGTPLFDEVCRRSNLRPRNRQILEARFQDKPVSGSVLSEEYGISTGRVYKIAVDSAIKLAYEFSKDLDLIEDDRIRIAVDQVEQRVRDCEAQRPPDDLYGPWPY